MSGVFRSEMSTWAHHCVLPDITQLHIFLWSLSPIKFTDLNPTPQKTFPGYHCYAGQQTEGCRYQDESETDFSFKVTVKRGRQAAGQIASVQYGKC